MSRISFTIESAALKNYQIQPHQEDTTITIQITEINAMGNYITPEGEELTHDEDHDDSTLEEKPNFVIPLEEGWSTKRKRLQNDENHQLDAELLESIPPLLRNIPPGILQQKEELEKFKLDLSYRPDSPVESDYKRIPIQGFGEAVLRGMGWTPGESCVHNVNIRPMRLGLGAEPLRLGKRKI